MLGELLQASACWFAIAALTRSVLPVCRSCTKTSGQLVHSPQSPVSPAARLSAVDVKTTHRPFAEMLGSALHPLACVPSLATLTRSVHPVCPSCTKMSATPLVSHATRLLAPDAKAIKRPSVEMLGLLPLPGPDAFGATHGVTVGTGVSAAGIGVIVGVGDLAVSADAGGVAVSAGAAVKVSVAATICSSPGAEPGVQPARKKRPIARAAHSRCCVITLVDISLANTGPSELENPC